MKGNCQQSLKRELRQLLLPSLRLLLLKMKTQSQMPGLNLRQRLKKRCQSSREMPSSLAQSLESSYLSESLLQPLSCPTGPRPLSSLLQITAKLALSTLNQISRQANSLSRIHRHSIQKANFQFMWLQWLIPQEAQELGQDHVACKKQYPNPQWLLLMSQQALLLLLTAID